MQCSIIKIKPRVFKTKPKFNNLHVLPNPSILPQGPCMHTAINSITLKATKCNLTYTTMLSATRYNSYDRGYYPAQCNKIQLSLLLLMTADMQQNATTFDNCCILLHSAWLGMQTILEHHITISMKKVFSTVFNLIQNVQYILWRDFVCLCC